MLPLSKSSPRPKAKHSFSFEAIGTQWSVEIYGPVSDIAALEQQARARIDEFDKVYSRFRHDSLVMQMSRRAGAYRLPEDARPLMRLYWSLYELSDGEITPLIGQTLADAGYDAAYSLVPRRELTSPPAWEDAIEYRDPELAVKAPALLDFGAVGKGYLVDIVADLLSTHGVAGMCVDAGGDIMHRHPGGPSITVGLEHPDDATLLIGTAEISNTSICGSAGNRRAWGKYHHIMSPSRLEPMNHLRAVWAVADSTLLADALTTALYFVPIPVLHRHFTFEYLLVNADNSADMSAGFPGELFA